MRRVVLVGIGFLGLLFVVGLGFFGWINAQMPKAQGDRVDGPDGLLGIETGGSYAWIVPLPLGVVLVDTGLDPSAGPLLAALAERGFSAADVSAILVTHGHLDHTSGLAAFPAAEVWVGPGEGPLLRGEVQPGGFLPRLFGRMMSAPPVPAKLREATDGQELDLGGERFGVIHIPGHTSGSVAYHWRDLLFTGASLVGMGDGVTTMPAAFADDIVQNVASLSKLTDLSFTRIADGHSGIVTTADAKLKQFMAR